MIQIQRNQTIFNPNDFQCIYLGTRRERMTEETQIDFVSPLQRIVHIMMCNVAQLSTQSSFFHKIIQAQSNLFNHGSIYLRGQKLEFIVL